MISGKIKADFKNTKYKVIEDCAIELGWKPIVKKDDSNSVMDKKKAQVVDLYWHDLYIDI